MPVRPAAPARLWTVEVNENVPFDHSVAALAARSGGDVTTARVAYEVLAFGKLGHSTRTQVAALFMVNELRGRLERARRPARSVSERLVGAWSRLRGH